MVRMSGLEKKDAPWHLRWFYGAMRKMFGKDLTPVKQQMRKPGLVWGGIAMEAGLAESAECPCVTFSWQRCGQPREWAVRFELTLILPWAGKQG